MKFYVALGGIACQNLKTYSNLHQDHISYYLDTDPATVYSLDKEDRFYLIPNFQYGTGAFRQIGKNATKYEIYSGKLNHFFTEIKESEHAEIILLTSSFGGFGSAAVIEILDFLECMLHEKANQNRNKHCRIIAFNESLLKWMSFPAPLIRQYELNTLELLADMASRKSVAPALPYVQTMRPLFNPVCSFFLPDTTGFGMNDIHQLLGMSETELLGLDAQHLYTIKGKKVSPPVFISYSTKDQSIADLLADTLKERNIDSWIATRNIKEGSYAKQIMQGIRDAKVFVVLLSAHSIASEQVKNEIDRAFSRLNSGLKIVPFIIDDAELDDDCSYYLCRQEFYFGKTPPIIDRIQELVDKITDMLE